ncbi:MAG: chloride channel protein [Muribaculum sp.]|nr:chloride channel protein [Muribaculum sp.]
MNPHVNQLQHQLHRIGRDTRGWSRRHIPEKAFVFILGSVIGFIVGFGAFLLKKMIAFVSHLLTDHLHADSGNLILILIPLAGIILTGIICRYLFRDNLTDGVTMLMGELKKKMFKIRASRTVTFLLASTVTLGFGGSAGSEGPIANTGAAIGSNLAQRFRLPPDLLRVMIGCGAAAGIAGIFKSPLGGALFTLEVLRMELTTLSVLVLLVTTITAAMTAYLFSGGTLDLNFTPDYGFDLGLIPWVILLGIFCGLYSLYYTYFAKKIAQGLHLITNPWVKNVTAGVLLGCLVMIFPPLYGEGYNIIGEILNGSATAIFNDSIFFHDNGDTLSLLLVAGGVLLAKSFSMSATNHGGGVSGDFAPTLFAGSFAGLFFALGLNELFGVHLPVALFAYLGMAGVMAGAIRAPLMAIFLTCEMCGLYTFFFPLMVTSALGFGVVRLFTSDSYFTRKIDRHNGLIAHIKKHIKKNQAQQGQQNQTGN